MLERVSQVPAEAVIKGAEFTTSFHDPKLAIAGAATLGVAAAVDFGKELLEGRAKPDNGEVQPAPADPFLAERTIKGNRLTKIAERTGYWATAVAVSLGLVQIAAPYKKHSKQRTNGTATLILPADWSADTQDMTDHGSPVSRLQASEEAALDLAKRLPIPVSIILEGSHAYTLSVSSKQTEQAQKQINSTLKPTFRNGQSASDAVRNALPLSGSRTTPNTIVLMTSSLTTEDAAGIQETEQSLKVQYPADSIKAEVIGQSGDNVQQVGAATLSVSANPQSVESAIGAKNVAEAQTVSQLESNLESQINAGQTTVSEHNVYLPGYLAIFSGLIAGAAAVGRRISGIPKLLRRRS